MSHTPIEGFRPSLQQRRHGRHDPSASAWLHALLPPGTDPARLRAALGRLLERHEILRTRLTAVPGLQLPVQVIADAPACGWQTQDLRALDASARAERLAATRDTVRQAVQDPAQPALAAALLVSDDADHLLLALPAANTDRASLERLLAELAADLHGQAPDEPPVQYADFAEWQHELQHGPDGNPGRAYWQRQAAPELLAASHPFQQAGIAAGTGPAACQLRLSADQADALHTALAGLNTSPAVLFGLCWATLLQRQLGQPRLLLAWQHDGRNDATRSALGPYAKWLPLPLEVAEDQPLAALAGRLASQHDEAALWQESWPGQDQAPAFAFAYHPATATPWPLQALECPAEPFALALAVQPQDAGFLLTLHHDARLDARAAQLLLDQFQHLCRQAATGPGLLRTASALSPAQRGWLADLNATATAIARPALLHQLFEAQARLSPEAPALSHAETRLSYRELDGRANQLAHRLLHAGLQAGQPVGLFLGRSVEAIVALLAILKAGGAYLPLDPAYPSDRLADMLAQTRAPLLLSTTALRDRLPPGGYRPLWLDADNPAAAWADHAPALVLHPEHAAYLIFTSGSTGQPKGVVVSHRNAVHSTTARWVGYPEPLRAFLLVSGLAFDSSVAGLFWTLSRGGCLCLPEDGDVQDAHALSQLIAAECVSHTLMLPSLYAHLLDQPRERLRSLRCAIVAGEACPATVAARHRDTCPQANLYNEYGPTEGSVWSSVYHCRGDEQGVLPIGRAIANMQMWVLDDALEPVAPGIAGELYLGGDGITPGYLDRPALTAERFLPNPFGAPGSRLYRSGDIGQLNAHGELEFLGRSDHQVKIRGFRIELGEIEARLLSHPGVREAAVLARANAAGEAELIAYVVPRAVCPGAQALRAHLAAQLPEHMLPAAVVTLPALPLTPNGKLDRAALPDPERTAPRPYRAPRAGRDQQVAALWAEVLGCERIGLDDHFFELGGHSLTATRLISRLRSALGLEVPVRALFQHPTLDAFLAQALPAAPEAGLAPIAPAPRDQALPLSFAQERLWLFDRLYPGHPAYHVAEAVRLTGPLDRAALARAFTELQRRHESLRTGFALEHGQPVQRILPTQPFPLPLLDLRPLAPTERERALRQELDHQALAPFDLTRSPLCRAGLIQLADDVHVLWLGLHHIISDGWSMRLLRRELDALYRAHTAGQPAPLAEPARQYADFAHWQRHALSPDLLQTQLDYWREQHRAPWPHLTLPGLRPAPAWPSHRGASHAFRLDATLAEALRALSQRQSVTLFMTLLAAFELLLAGHSGQTDLRIGLPIANRHRQEVENTIGCFVNTLALRADLGGNPTLAQYLAQVRTRVLGAQAHQDLPIEQLLPTLARTGATPPRLQVMFDLHAERLLPDHDFGGLRIDALEEGSTHSTLFELMLDIGERDDGLAATFTYGTDRLDAATIAHLAADYERLLRRCVAEPEAPLRHLQQALQPLPPAPAADPVEPAAELHTVLAELLGRETLAPNASFFDLGGRSLTAVQLCARLGQRWGTTIPPQLVFLHPVLADLERVLVRYAREAVPEEETVK